MPDFKKNDLIELEIASLSQDGNGVGRFGGFVVFVPMAAPGDVIEAKIVKVLKSHAFAIISKLLAPSPRRAENDCPVYARCGGCSLRHIDYAHELELKSSWVRDCLERIGGVKTGPMPITPSNSTSRYRNKAQYPVRLVDGEIRAGFFAPRSHMLVPVADCLLQPAFFRDIVEEIISFMKERGIKPYDEEARIGTVRHIFIRHAETTGETMVCLVINARSLESGDVLAGRLRSRCETVKTVLVNENRSNTNVIFGGNTSVVAGSGYITDRLAGVGVRLSAKSFYQVNRSAAEALYSLALNYAAPDISGELLDLYCGAGTIGLSMAKNAGKITGVEIVAEAVADAKRNAAANGITNAVFVHADAAAYAEAIIHKSAAPDAVIVDPPRKGLDVGLPAAISKISPKRLVYISCNPATLARDVKRLGDFGFSLAEAQAVDLFPRTAHVECAALLTR